MNNAYRCSYLSLNPVAQSSIYLVKIIDKSPNTTVKWMRRILVKQFNHVTHMMSTMLNMRGQALAQGERVLCSSTDR